MLFGQRKESVNVVLLLRAEWALCGAIHHLACNLTRDGTHNQFEYDAPEMIQM